MPQVLLVQVACMCTPLLLGKQIVCHHPINNHSPDYIHLHLIYYYILLNYMYLVHNQYDYILGNWDFLYLLKGHILQVYVYLLDTNNIHRCC